MVTTLHGPGGGPHCPAPHKRLVACVNNNIKWTMAKLIVSPYELLITQLRCRAIRPGRRRCQLHQSTPAPCTASHRSFPPTISSKFSVGQSLPIPNSPTSGSHAATSARRARRFGRWPNLFSPNAAPRNVSQVCRHWRNVALDYAPLWATVAVHDSAVLSNKVHLSNLHFRLKDRLARSREVPLTLSAAVGYRSLIPGERGCRDVTNLAAAFSMFFELAIGEQQRWKRVSLSSFIQPVDMSFIRFDNLPLLEQLALRIPVRRIGDYNLELPIEIDLSSCTNLDTLKLDGDFKLSSDGTILEKAHARRDCQARKLQVRSRGMFFGVEGHLPDPARAIHRHIHCRHLPH